MQFTKEVFHDKPLNEIIKELEETASLLNDCISFDDAIDQGENIVEWRTVHSRLLLYAVAAEKLLNASPGTTVRDFSSKQGDNTTTHGMFQGNSLCGSLIGRPYEWPKGHYQTPSNDVPNITCLLCLTKVGGKK